MAEYRAFWYYQFEYEEQKIANAPRRNDGIRGDRFRLVAEDGRQMGIMPRAEALKLAAEEGKDLIEVSSSADPPVVKVADWGKYNYQRTKQLQRTRKNARAMEVKQIRMGLKIGDHDLDIKLRKAFDFLEAGHKVKITLVYRGRELAHKDLGFNLAKRITEKLGDRAVVDQEPQFAGRQLNFVVRKNNAKVKDTQSNEQEDIGNKDR